MKGFTPRFAAPLDAPRPRGARLLEAFSPKLGRRVRLFDHACFEQWIRLEADPSVLWLCERPARLGAARDARHIDFWVQRCDGEQLLLVDRAAEPTPETVIGLPVHRIAAAELAAAAMWVSNWQRMLPVVTCELRDAPGYRPDAALWNVAVRSCGYIQSRQAMSQELMAAAV